MLTQRTIPLASIVLLSLAIFTTPAPAAFTPPKDKNFTEKQLTGYIEVMKQYIADQRAAAKALQGSSGLAGVAVVNQMNDKYKASIVAHGMSEEEFNWVAGQVSLARFASIRDQMQAKMKDDLDKQLKANQDKLADMKKTQADYQKAQTDGRRVMTADERKAAVDSATEDQKTALDEAKQHADEAKAAQADADKAGADQKTAEAALKNPPKFDNDDDKNAFVQEKQNAIQSAKDAKKEALDKVAEAKKAESMSLATAAGAAARIKDPDVPLTPEDKAAAKQQNDDRIKDLADNIKQTEDGQKLLQDAGNQQLKIFGEDKDRPPEQSVMLFKKHEKEYNDALGIAEQK